VCAWSDIKGYSIAQLTEITDGVTDANASYMQTYTHSHVKDLCDVLKINAFMEQATAVAADATPSVTGISVINIPAAVTISDFDDGTNGQVLEVIADVDNVIIAHNASLIKLPMALNITLYADDYMYLKLLSGIWTYRGHQHF
jgi:hypothetical protein